MDSVDAWCGLGVIGFSEKNGCESVLVWVRLRTSRGGAKPVEGEKLIKIDSESGIRMMMMMMEWVVVGLKDLGKGNGLRGFLILVMMFV